MKENILKLYKLFAYLLFVLPSIAGAQSRNDVVDTKSRLLLSSLSAMETCGKGIGEPYLARRSSLEAKVRELVDVAGFDAELFWKTYRKKIDAYMMVDHAIVPEKMEGEALKEFRSNCEMLHRAAVQDEALVSDAVRKLQRRASAARTKNGE